MDCSTISSLTLGQAYDCLANTLAPLNERFSAITVGQWSVSIVGVCITPALIASFQLPFLLMRKMFKRLFKGYTYTATKDGDGVRHTFIMWFMVSGVVGFVVAINMDSQLLLLASIWLLICTTFFIVAGKRWWGAVIGPDGERVYS